MGEFALEQKRIHRDMLRDHLKEEKLNSIKLKVKAFLFVSEQNPTCKSFFFTVDFMTYIQQMSLFVMNFS